MGKVCCLGDEVKEGSYADLFTGAQVYRFRPAIRTRCHDNPPGAIRDIGRKLPGRVFPSPDIAMTAALPSEALPGKLKPRAPP